MRSFMLLALSLNLSVVFADDWPCLRGPHLDGVSQETDAIEAWGESGPVVLWSQPLGQGYSAIAVANGMAVTHYQNAFHQYIVCFDASTGERLWEHDTGLPYEAVGLYPGPRATPTISAGRVYFVTPEAVLGCLSLKTGDLVWEVDMQSMFSGKGTEFGYSASPLVFNGRVIVPVGGEAASIVAFDADSGDVVWKSGSEPASYCTVMPIVVQGRPLLVSYLQNHITIVDADTGSRLWSDDISVGYDEHSAMPVWSDPYLIFSAPFRAGATAYRLAFEGEAEDSKLVVQPAWQSDKMSNDTASSVAVDGLLYGFDLRDQQAKAHRSSRGTFRCLDCGTGEVVWSDSLLGHATVIGVGQQLLLFTDAGDPILGRGSRDGFQEQARTNVFAGEICWTPPAYADGKLYMRSPSQVVCLQMGKESASNADISHPRVTTSDLRKRKRIDLGWLLNGEREHPFMVAPIEDTVRWFGATFCCAILPALVVTAFTGRRTESFLRVFGVCCIGLSVAATPLLNDVSEHFWLTIPGAVFGAVIMALGESESLRRDVTNRLQRRRARIAGFVLIAVAAGYFWLLRDQSLPHEWVFLVGLLPVALAGGWAFRVAAVWKSRVAVACLVCALFPLYFWSGPTFQVLRTLLKGSVLSE